MALITLDVDRSLYGNGKKWIQAAMDSIVDDVEEGALNVNYNLTQLAAEGWGTSIVSFDNDGVSNRTNSLYNKQSGSDTDVSDTTIATVGAWTDVDATDASITFTPELAGKFWLTCTLHLRHIPSNATNVVDVLFRLTDGTTNSNAIRFFAEDMPNGKAQYNPLSLFYDFDFTAVSKTVKLQYYITTSTANAIVVAASATAPTYFHYQKI